MKCLKLDGNVREYMRFEKVLDSAQGMAIWQDEAFVLYDTGMCGVYDLITRKPQPIASFPLGSYNIGSPTKDYLNHANQAMFSSRYWEGNPIPLLYVTIGTGIGRDDDGFYYRCAVENIRQTETADGNKVYEAETLQTITYCPEGELPEGCESPCWGCPAFFIDTDKGLLYIVSARYRTKKGCVPEGKQNAYIVTTFPLPELSRGTLVHLYPRDITDQFVVNSDILFTQGGTLLQDKIYYTFGCPPLGYPLHMLVFDLVKKSMCVEVDLTKSVLGEEEIECCAPYKGMLLCNTCEGGIYVVQEGILPWKE